MVDFDAVFTAKHAKAGGENLLCPGPHQVGQLVRSDASFGPSVISLIEEFGRWITLWKSMWISLWITLGDNTWLGEENARADRLRSQLCVDGVSEMRRASPCSGVNSSSQSGPVRASSDERLNA